MIKKVLVVLWWLVAFALATHEQDLFNNYVKTFNKQYQDDAEYSIRLKIFLDHIEKIKEHNRGNSHYQLGLNQFADMSNEEYQQQMLSSFSMGENKGSSILLEKEGETAPPASVDWRTRTPPAVVPVRNEGICGSALAISVVDSIAGEYAVQKNDSVYSFDIQTIVNCSGNGCGGQSEVAVWSFIQKYGLWWYYDNTCPTGPGIGICIDGPNCTSYKTESDLQADVANKGPISVLVDASLSSFQLYTSGVYSDPQCSQNRLNHALQVVGYGTTSGVDYWIARNSWGPNWGMKGDILIARNKGNVCGIASHGCYAVNVRNCVCEDGM